MFWKRRKKLPLLSLSRGRLGKNDYIMNDNEKVQQFGKLWVHLSDEDREKIYAHLQALSSEPAASPAPHQ